MKRRLVIFALLLCGLVAQPAGAQEVNVHENVTSFFQSLLSAPLDTIKAKVFALVDAAAPQGKEVQSTLAGMAFDYFNSTPVMGVEAVSVDVAKKYFLSGDLPWKGGESPISLEAFISFNELSQVGCQAQDLLMESITGEWISLRSLTSGNKVLYFYSSGCSSCAKETAKLAQIAAGYEGDPIYFVTVFGDSDRTAWETYVAENFAPVENSKVTFIHLWDPEMKTGFQKKYGVVTTPMMYLIDSQNIIVGRRLNGDVLAKMLNILHEDKADYKQLFDRVFSALAPVEEADAAAVVDAMASKTEADSTLFRESMFELYQYLRFSDTLSFQAGAIYLAENYIVARPSYWAPEFVSSVADQLARLRRNPIDAPAKNLVLQDKRGRNRNLLTNNEKYYYNIIVFHLVNCEDCEKMIKQLKNLNDLFYDMQIGVTMVYVGENEELWKKFIKKNPLSWRYLRDKKNTRQMFDVYDIETVPRLYLLDEDNVVIAKDISIDVLVKLLPFL